MSNRNAWTEKAVELDRFRWALVRNRHSLFGSMLRFIRDAITDCGLGLLAKLCLAEKVNINACDFLLLQSAPRIIKLKRKARLIDSLRRRGFNLCETALPDPLGICASKQLIAPQQSVPLRYFIYASHAEWLVKKYQPRILLNDRNGSLYSPFLRLALSANHALLVQLAHATTLESSRRLSMNDYDFYFLFGSSSLSALQNRPLLFGSSKVVLTGSHMIDSSFEMVPATPEGKTLLLLGVGPDKEKEEGYQRTYELIRDWAQSHPSYKVIVKPHPRSAVPFWHEAAECLSNIRVLPPERALASALSEANFVINIMSNAVIEASLAERPIVFCNHSDDLDIFDQERFFGPAVTHLEDFQARVLCIEQNFAAHVESSRAFAHYHLAHGTQGLEKTVLALECLVHRSPLSDDLAQHYLHQTL